MVTHVAKSAAGFAGRLRSLREDAGLTQVQLANRAGMHSLSVAKLERGERRPSWETVVSLANALGITPNDFLTDDGDDPSADDQAEAGE